MLFRSVSQSRYAFGVDDELIQKSANLLLTFKQVQNQVGEGNNIFDRAVITAQDLGNVFGSADAAAMQLGKALSDPAKGITALRRAGINFTEQQKQQIKTLVQSGDVLGAQKLILAEVESQVGGTAAASATGFDRMRVAVGNVAEEFGAILIPYIEKFANFVTQKVVPYLMKLADVLGEKGVGAAIGMLAGDFLNMTTNMGKTGNIILGLATAFLMLKAATVAFTIAETAATIAITAFGVAWNATGIGLIAAAIAAVVVGLIALYVKFEAVRKVVNMLGEILKFVVMNAIAGVYNYFVSFINVAITGINLLIKAANFFGADIEEIGTLGYMAFTGIGNAASTARKKIGGVAEVAGAMAEKEGGVQKVAKALKDVGSAAGGVGGGGGAAKAVETAQERLQKYIDALKGMSSAQKSARDADKSLMKSRTSLAEATLKLTDAQAYFNQVVAGYGADSKQAKDRQLALRKAQGAVEKAGYDVEQSVFAVAKAEQDLADIRKDPESSPMAIREAEIALAEAKLGVKDATEAQVEATDALAEAERLLDEAINGAKEGSDAYTEALDRLNDAKKAQADAEEAVTDAIERQIEAVERLIEAQEKAAGLRVGGAGAAAAEAKYGSPFSSAVGIGRGVAEMSAVARGVLTQDQADALAMRRYTPFATGGIVTQPTRALIGEAGAEAVIPLDRLQSGMTVNVTVNAGMGADAATIGDEIVNVLQRYNRRNGALPLKVA